MPEGGIRFMSGVGPARAARLEKLGICSGLDLLMHIPRSYIDRRSITRITDLVPGRSATVSGTIAASGFRRSKNGKRVFRAELEDGSGRLSIIFFNAAFMESRLRAGARIMATGSITSFHGAGMVHPDIVEAEDQNGWEPTAVLPVYPLTEGLTQGVIRMLVARVLEKKDLYLPELLPAEVLGELGWTGRREVLEKVHSPGSPEEGERARRTLALEELYVYQSVLREVRRRSDVVSGMALRPPDGLLRAFMQGLPWRLTSSQESAIEKVTAAMSRSVPMRMLLQGDVGSGKTVVAAAACLVCCAAGRQAVVAAPTEVLAAQHHRTLQALLGPHGIRCGLITGGTAASMRSAIDDALRSGELNVLVGTHALFEETVSVPGMGLCIIDEQHKFGVEQREKLLEGLIPRPHMLIMSATPIPRTLAMTIYGDLDMSVLDGMPPGRGRITTLIMSREQRTEVFRRLEERLSLGERAFIVYPLREASGDGDLRDASSSYEVLRSGGLGRFGVGLLTGAMKPAEKLATVGRFVSGEISLLVSTTVIEVGIDVPEATVMVVANAERFGLSQLHQLRGRVGRGGRDSWCFLMKGPDSGREAIHRLAILEETCDGFRIAARDLELRGPGEIAGTRQHGIPSFRIASLADDADLVEKAASIAAGIRPSEALRSEFERRFGSTAPPGV